MLLDEPSKDACAEHAQDAYREASELAAMHLPAIHLTRLSLALNYSVFLHEVVGVLFLPTAFVLGLGREGYEYGATADACGDTW